MARYDDIKTELLDVNKAVRQVLRTALSTEGLATASLDLWLKTTNHIQRQLAEETVRMAVVGSIKSGKSTLTNFLFNGDHVKRGAGVVTSIITKIRPGKENVARLEFKTWDEINAEMNQALILFGSVEADLTREDFDINRQEDRTWLREALSKLGAEHLISGNARDPNSVLLMEYLKGYDRAKAYVSYDRATRVLQSHELDQQKDFVSDESLAVYLKDVSLELKGPEGFGENLEVADCQGSDSPNPLHLAMIQDYLIQTHLIVYVISSRTGLRQADIRFLTLMKKMGLSGNIIFVLNCDFSEHEDLADIKRMVARAEDELNMILSPRRLFALSALFNLFRSLASQSDGLSRKDQLRLEQWQEEADMVAFSDMGTKHFLEEVTQKVSVDRLNLLVAANVERLSKIARGAKESIRVSRNLVRKTAGEVKETITRMDKRRKVTNQIVVTIKDTLEGTTAKVKRDMGNEVNRFFDIKYGDIAQDIVRFIDSHDVPAAGLSKDVEASGFLMTLYHVFQKLQQATNTHIAEQINPRIVEFVSELEGDIEEVFRQICSPYGLMIQDAVDQHYRVMEELGIEATRRPVEPISCPDVATTKRDIHLSIPRLAATMDYSTRIKTEAILRLGLYNTWKGAKKLFRRGSADKLDSALRSLEHSIRRMKEQMKDSITEHFTDYSENFKFQYVFTLVDAMSKRLYEDLTDQLKAFTGDLTGLRELVENEERTKGGLSEALQTMEQSLEEALDSIDRIKHSARSLERIEAGGT
jgi:hypothetical protein